MKDKKSMRILYVEDDETIRDLVKIMLKGAASTLDMASNGREGVERFKEAEYDLVFMDIQMPVLDGLDACKEMRAWEEEQGKRPTPVVALTAHGLEEDKIRSREVGCDGHIIKPMQKKDLLDALEKYTKARDIQ